MTVIVPHEDVVDIVIAIAPSEYTVDVVTPPTPPRVDAYSGGAPGPPGADSTVPGPPGVDGLDGTDGADGVGVPAGGTTGQVLTKHGATDYDTQWSTPASGAGLPVGGSVGQYLAKQSSTNFDATWGTPPTIPVGGTTGQVLTKDSGTDFDASWHAPSGGMSDLNTYLSTNSYDIVPDPTPTYTATPTNVVGGNYGPGVNIGMEHSFTLTANPYDGVDIPIGQWPKVGTPIYIHSDISCNYNGAAFQGPMPYTNMIGPRGYVHIEGWTRYIKSGSWGGTTFGGIEPIGFALQTGIRNAHGLAVHPGLTPAWGYMNARMYIADGATIGAQSNDTLTGAAGFIDNPIYIGTDADGGYWNATTKTNTSFASTAAYFGHVDFGEVRGFYYGDPNVHTGTELGGALDAKLGITLAGTTRPTLTDVVAFRTNRLTAGTNNYAMRAYNTIDLNSDTNTYVASSPDPANGIYLAPNPHVGIQFGGTHTLNYPFAGGFVGIAAVGTWIFQQTATPFGAYVAMNVTPTLRNHASLTGAWGALTNFVNVRPTIQGDTTNGAASFGTINGYYSDQHIERSAGSGTFTVSQINEHLAQANVGTGCVLSVRNGFLFKDAVGSGTLTTQTAIYIEALTKATNNFGIINLSSTVLQGQVYGGFGLGPGDFNVKPNAGYPTQAGSIVLDGPVQIHPSALTSTSTSGFVYCTVPSAMQLTLNAASGNAAVGYAMGPVVNFSGPVSIFGSAQFSAGGIWQNTTGIAQNLGLIIGFSSSATLRTQAQNISSTYVGFFSSPIFGNVASGTMTATATGFQSDLNSAVGGSVTTRYGFVFNDATTSSTGTVATQYGVYIPALSKGTVANWGIYNLATTMLSSLTLGVDTTYTAATVMASSTATYTLNFADATWGATRLASNVVFQQSGSIFGSVSAFADSNNYKNLTSTVANLGPIFSFLANPTLSADTATISTNSSYSGFRAAPVTSRIGASGALTLSTVYGFQSLVNVGANTTVTTWAGFRVDPPTNAGTLTTAIGLDIGAFAVGSTNIGIRLGEGMHVVVGTSTGTMFGTAVGQRIGFYGKTPVIQSSGSAQAAAPAGGTGTAAGAYDTAANRDALINLVNAMRTTLVNLGLMKGSA